MDGYILLVFVGWFIVMVVLTFSDRIVIFYDRSDVAITLAPYGIMLLAIAIGAFLPAEMPSEEAEEYKQFFLNLGYIGSLACFAKSMINAIRYNRSWASGSMAGLFKVLISVPMLLTLAMILTSDEDDEGWLQYFIAVIFTAVVGAAFWFTFVNGQRVHERRGWA